MANHDARAIAEQIAWSINYEINRTGDRDALATDIAAALRAAHQAGREEAMSYADHRPSCNLRRGAEQTSYGVSVPGPFCSCGFDALRPTTWDIDNSGKRRAEEHKADG
jgi:hypothetical protein